MTTLIDQGILDQLRAHPDGLTSADLFELLPPRADGKSYSDTHVRKAIFGLADEGRIVPLPGATYRRRYGLPADGQKPVGKSANMTTRERYEALAKLGCIACRGLTFKVPQKTEIHHQNAGGHAGQKKLGNRFTIPLCGWHHRGEPLSVKTKTEMTAAYGPSLAEQSKAFRLTFGDDLDLLGKADKLIGWVS